MDTPNDSRGRQLPVPQCGPLDVSNPLRDVVLCCTAVPPETRVELASQVEQMGAQHKYDLTCDVTHLIVGDYKTDKYKYVARERPDIKVMTVKWVKAVRELWIQGLAVDVQELERTHALATFTGLRICLTGFGDPIERQKIIDDVTGNGAEYHGDLTSHVTHLIAHRPEGQKYKHARAWGLKIVAIEWLRDSLERGMILDEELYDPEEPREERGKGAWVRQSAIKSPPRKRSRNNSATGLGDGKRKLRRTASSKLLSQNEDIWGDIVGSRAKPQTLESGQWEELDRPPSELEAVDTATQRQGPVDATNVSNPTVAIKCGTFSGCQFHIHGFDPRKADLVRHFLLSHHAEISNTIGELSSALVDRNFVVIPHDMPAFDVPNIPQPDKSIRVVTEWWIEHCLEAKTFFDPPDYVLGLPFPVFPIPKFDEITICSTGFAGVQLLHISKAVALIGAKYEEFFSRDASVLICNFDRLLRREKLALAQEWKIPVVPLAWLLDSITSGARQSFDPYIQRGIKNKADQATSLIVDVDLVGGGKHDGAETKNEIAKIRSQGAKDKSRAAIVFEMDKTAFQSEEAPTIATEEFTPVTTYTPVAEALKEISPNSQSKSKLSPFKGSRDTDSAVAPTLEQRETIGNTISSLLAKSKTAVVRGQDHCEQANGHEGIRRKRAPKMFGRVASNTSTTSSITQSSSVDSAGSSGQSTAWTTLKNLTGNEARKPTDPGGADNAIFMLLSEGGANPRPDDKSPPPMTQMRYDDWESTEYKEQVIARVTGTKIEKKAKERAPTIASLDSLRGRSRGSDSTSSGGKKTRTLRERMNRKAPVEERHGRR